MDKYVEKNALIRSVCATYSGCMNTFFAKPNDFVNIIEDAPTVHVTEERHAHWEKLRFFSALFRLYRCSACEHDNEKTHYCPECGARMDEEEP